MKQFADDLGKLVLRVAVGVLVLMHGIYKVVNGVGFVKSMVLAHHLPGWLAYFVYVGEVVGPLLILLGVFTRFGALLIVANMIVALALAHGGQLFGVSDNGGWQLELQGMFLFGALTIALIGAGRFSGGGRYR